MRSDTVTKGVQQAPHRSLFNALGMTQEELDRPLIGVVSSYNEIVPGHMNLDKITEAVKMGVAMAGGTPIVVPAIAVCDGIAMGHIGMKYSLVTRDLIADSTEALAMAHQFDGLVMIPNCDKNVPGLLMAAARVNIPTIFVSGGPMLAGHVKGEKTSLSSMFEAVGAHAAGRISDEELCEYENKACPTCGSCCPACWPVRFCQTSSECQCVFWFPPLAFWPLWAALPTAIRALPFYWLVFWAQPDIILVCSGCPCHLWFWAWFSAPSSKRICETRLSFIRWI